MPSTSARRSIRTRHCRNRSAWRPKCSRAFAPICRRRARRERFATTHARRVASMTSESSAAPHRVVIVGGGAGGLELATKLGDKLGRRRRIEVTLIERARTHFWKPHLHELAAGSMDLDVYETDYLAQSHWHSFGYRIGQM